MLQHQHSLRNRNDLVLIVFVSSKVGMMSEKMQQTNERVFELSLAKIYETRNKDMSVSFQANGGKGMERTW